jgi:FkbM family methyltransferase
VRNPLPLARYTLRGLGRSIAIAAGGQPSLALDYARLHVAAATSSLRRAQPPFRARIGGFDVEFADFGDLLLLIGEIFLDGCYDLAIEPPRLIVDGGANIGLATLRLARRHPYATVIAVEAEPRTFALLQHNVSENGLAGRVELHNAALGGADGFAQLFADELPGGVHTALRAQPGRPEHQPALTVTARRLSTLLAGRDIDFLKLDIEGGEMVVLRDLETSGALDRVQAIVCEGHAWPGEDGTLAELIGLLNRHGFQTRVLGGDTKVPGFRTGLVYATSSRIRKVHYAAS